MTVVSSKEFASHQDKYFEIAMEEQVYIQNGVNMFLLTYKNMDEKNIYNESNVYDEVLEPDEDFNRAFSAEEFRERLTVVLDKVDKKYASKCK